ncbi:MAG TPA: Uma2 family endonuclease [Bryobacteraceae bacterium]|jgi:Uma2 family endonuclease|nr:Uma2 family endonuclease [Bryobacteraceae bacterium]
MSAFLRKNAPDEQIIRTPPVLCIEILSREDRIDRYEDRVNDYFEMGVSACWIIDSRGCRGWLATPGRFDEVEDGVLRFGEFEMPVAAVVE